jgi:hypothetical protein
MSDHTSATTNRRRSDREAHSAETEEQNTLAELQFGKSSALGFPGSPESQRGGDRRKTTRTQRGARCQTMTSHTQSEAVSVIISA